MPIEPSTGLITLDSIGKNWTAVLSLDLIIFALSNMLRYPPEEEQHQSLANNS